MSAGWGRAIDQEVTRLEGRLVTEGSVESGFGSFCLSGRIHQEDREPKVRDLFNIAVQIELLGKSGALVVVIEVIWNVALTLRWTIASRIYTASGEGVVRDRSQTYHLWRFVSQCGLPFSRPTI